MEKNKKNYNPTVINLFSIAMTFLQMQKLIEIVFQLQKCLLFYENYIRLIFNSRKM